MFEHREIEADEVGHLLTLDEGHYLDFKRIEIKPSKLTESISAFANTAGGELFIGIGESDDKKSRFWHGFERLEDANNHIDAIEAMSPLANHYQASFLRSRGQQGSLLHIIIPKTRDILNASDGNAYVRRNAQNRRVVGEDGLRRLRLDKGIVSFEDEIINTDKMYIVDSHVTTGFIIDVVPSAQPEEWMVKQNLLVDGRPTVAGILLFSDEPQAALPKRSAVKVYRYKTRDEEGARETLAFDPITIEGCLYDQVKKTVSTTKSLVEEIKRLGEKGLEAVVYPDETLHEIITNAVLHRDYSIPVDVLVRIYDNRIEVESPGRLPGHVTSANILDEQSARNPKIVRLINKFPDPPNKDVGEGLNTAFAAMKKLRLKEPEVIEKDNSVLVNIRHQPLASPHETVIKYLESHREITNRVARELCGIRSENSMKDVFLSLKRRGVIEPVPGKSGSASSWQKATGGVPEALVEKA